MHELHFDKNICRKCPTLDCLVRCQYMEFDLESARREKDRILLGEHSVVLDQCVTCYACEEYCPNNNHPFYQIVDLQESLGVNPVPVPITEEQVVMMKERGDSMEKPVHKPFINMCYFPMLTGSIYGPLYEGAVTAAGSDLFCNVMWLHFARNSVIRERLPRIVKRLTDLYMKPSGLDEMVCYHDECFGTYTQLAPAFGIDVPFKPVHLFDYLNQRLEKLSLEGRVKPLNITVAYQRPCSNRLCPQTQPLVDAIFEKIGADRPRRKYDRENALCCGGVMYAAQRDELADDVQDRNLDDMESVDAQYVVFNCPACFFTLGESVSKRGMTPIFMSDLCQMAVS